MKVSGFLLAGLAALSMAGCATRGTTVDSPVLRDPAALAAAQAAQATRTAWLASQSDWSFAGRVAVNANGKGGSGRIDWQQTGSSYLVALSAPVTRQSWRLSGDLRTGAARLEGLEGGPRDGAEAGDLLRAATGWDIPVASMVHWARGVADPAAPAEGMEYGADGRPRTLMQHGWRVDYLDWLPAEGAQPAMPRRMEARRQDATVKVAVDQWHLTPP
ncbi:MAG TPA: lipoprotein insertase outer membrane protein LolB [Pseudoxanthomonas sp.]|uniref:lipoprotein insertase outer membrane protein LolB n=1 Tax=Pseudoxanthomonas sp. SE1 TaxID=1664560 RepID=UPI00240E133B|nr:lipoprotein insertase outer membrane protein LolB [Pseudoxanthomonas sp. SE1]WFC41078.1 lipoprotein insertase outer membrane protein LolB [Pseudoxanthomonas sp. SE1]HJS34592.1 lipoprotein insertase outer membrane protein LolB [Pseudoxanthomonas sp.]